MYHTNLTISTLQNDKHFIHTALIIFIMSLHLFATNSHVFYFFVYYILCIKLLACNRRNNSKLFKQIKLILTEKFIHRLHFLYLACGVNKACTPKTYAICSGS